MKRTLMLLVAVLLLSAAATGFIVTHRHAPFLACNSDGFGCVQQGWPKTTYDEWRSITWASLIAGFVLLAVGLIGLINDKAAPRRSERPQESDIDVPTITNW